ncbi:hypothetical protein J1605_006475 [Eschrichtius robustus]|uniref:Uncharacterized protein n=1 Tax=Eschrichtius robustus TaxID=9764 RepID=A0AB34H6E8_ESCRO|nr:hypothetical protein J1605_006475 [Eschrichtius robustus]
MTCSSRFGLSCAPGGSFAQASAGAPWMGSEDLRLDVTKTGISDHVGDFGLSWVTSVPECLGAPPWASPWVAERAEVGACSLLILLFLLPRFPLPSSPSPIVGLTWLVTVDTVQKLDIYV